MITQIILQIIILAVYIILTVAETSAISINDNLLERLAASGGKQAQKLKRLVSDPTKFLASLHSAMTVTGFSGAAVAAVGFSGKLAGRISDTGVNIPYTPLLLASAAITAVITAFFTITIGELVTKKLASRAPERLALKMSGFICFISKLFVPFVFLAKALSGAILRIFGIDPQNSENTVTEEEILMMSDAGAENGTIDEDENRIIKNIFAFDDLTAEQVCTHRTDVSVLWASDDIKVWEETIHRTRHSVFPVCGENVDKVIGVLDAKDYFRIENKSRENIMKYAVREPFFVHEGMKADSLFDQMKQTGSNHFAVVVDEYGGMSGIITITDLVEELVGDFADDEKDLHAAKFEQLSDDTWSIPGITSLSEVCEELDLSLPADKYDTFSGYVIGELGEIPRNGSQMSLKTNDLDISVVEVKHHRIELCKVTKIPHPVLAEELI